MPVCSSFPSNCPHAHFTSYLNSRLALRIYMFMLERGTPGMCWPYINTERIDWKGSHLRSTCASEHNSVRTGISFSVALEYVKVPCKAGQDIFICQTQVATPQ